MTEKKGTRRVVNNLYGGDKRAYQDAHRSDPRLVSLQKEVCETEIPDVPFTELMKHLYKSLRFRLEGLFKDQKKP